MFFYLSKLVIYGFHLRPLSKEGNLYVKKNGDGILAIIGHPAEMPVLYHGVHLHRTALRGRCHAGSVHDA